MAYEGATDPDTKDTGATEGGEEGGGIDIREMPDGIQRLHNLADEIEEDVLDSVGTELLEQVKGDIESRKEWLGRVENWVALATQQMEKKNYPWRGASNIKFPLLQTAAVQFHARAFPALLGNTSPVMGKVIGYDADGTKANRADRVGKFMSYQVLHDIEDWVDDMDRSLLILPLIGAMYKKTYYNPRTLKPVSEMIHPRDFIINYDARNFENARKTHRIWKTGNEIVELQNKEIYRQFDGDDVLLPPKTASESRDKTQGLSKTGYDDPYALQELYEVHCLYDYDEDGYKEPYIITIRESDGKVFRVTEGWNESEVERDEQGNTLAIIPKKYFTPYFFMPDPESKVHGLGFGTMVGPINEAVNTIINQLTDSGTINNLQGGFLGRGIRLKAGNMKWTPGEWKTINNTGDDLRKGIFPMPTKEPSNVLFQLLGLLIDSGKDLTSVQDLMVGRNPGQNQPFSTSQMVMEQGLKVFNGIYKRIYRAMSAEFKLLFEVNGEHPDLSKYMSVLDAQGMEIRQAMEEKGQGAVMEFLAKDFDTTDMNIIPTAEPDMVAEVQKAQKAESLMLKIQAGLPLNPMAVTKRMLESERHEDIDELLDLPEPPPDPEIEFRQQEMQILIVEAQVKAQVAEADIALKEAQAEILFAEAEGKDTERLHAQFIAEKKQTKEEFEALSKRLKDIADVKKDRSAGTPTSGSSS